MKSSCLRVRAAFIASILLALGSSACSDEESDSSGPGISGIDRGKYLDELSASEQSELCNWAIPLEGGGGPYSCSNGTTGTIYTIDECIAQETAVHCLVGLVEDCVLSIQGDPCNIWTSTACKTYLACAKPTAT